jgi:glycosyltransferase involved in cell wall biosynthesis
MASGRPIVATGIPAIRSILRHGENAVIAPPDDPESLATAIAGVLEDRATAARLAARSRDEVEQYTWDRRARDILTRFAPDLLRR